MSQDTSFRALAAGLATIVTFSEAQPDTRAIVSAPAHTQFHFLDLILISIPFLT
jgi:hypothetical protein